MPDANFKRIFPKTASSRRFFKWNKLLVLVRLNYDCDNKLSSFTLGEFINIPSLTNKKKN